MRAYFWPGRPAWQESSSFYQISEPNADVRSCNRPSAAPRDLSRTPYVGRGKVCDGQDRSSPAGWLNCGAPRNWCSVCWNPRNETVLLPVVLHQGTVVDRLPVSPQLMILPGLPERLSVIKTCMKRSKESNRTCPNPNCCLKGRLGKGNIIRHSFYITRQGRRRRYRCKECGRTFSSTRGTPYYRLHKPRSLFDEVVRMCVHGIAISAMARIKRMAWGTIARWLESAAT